MAHEANLPPAKRLKALAAVIALHAALLFLVLAIRIAAPTPPKTSSMSVFALNAAPAPPAAPVPPKSLSKLLEELRPPPTPAPPNEVNASGTPATGCTTLDGVAQALLANPVAVSSVLNAPPETRSIAEAIVIWNAGWSEAATTVDAPLAPVRESVRHTLADVDEACLDEQLAGPRLVPIPAGDGTMFLVFGSGRWSWRQLLTDPPTDQAMESFGSWKLRPPQ
ncbi:MAG: hypothetical protein M3Q83_05470 [Pseudomonadota bacterium]|nr:hypothetical protein [Pseudomonadota bacterium]